MRLVNLAEYESRARDIAEGSTLDYYDGGSNDELTLRDNAAAFSRITVYPRTFRGVGTRDMSTTVVGSSARWPVIVAPVALLGMLSPDGEVPAVRAATRAGSIFVLSTLSVTSIEDVIASSTGPVWFQLYIYKDRAASEGLVKRVEEAGCSALELTADTPILGRRERDVRNSFGLPEGLWTPNLTAEVGSPIPIPYSGSDSPFKAAIDALFYPDLTWDDVEWLTSITNLPVLIKGILRADDAVRAVDAGAAGVIVSNHGGRQVDTAPAAIDALAAIAEAVGDRTELIVDGGIRRGADVIKAIAMGARAVQIGRPIVWGLVVDGEQGVDDVLSLLRDELDLAMALTGCRSIDEITSDLLSLPRALRAGFRLFRVKRQSITSRGKRRACGTGRGIAVPQEAPVRPSELLRSANQSACGGRIERVADRLFEGEEAVLHVIECTVATLVSGSTHISRATSGRLSSADPISWRPIHQSRPHASAAEE